MIREDMLAMATGFGSVKVVAGITETRGLWDDAEIAAEVGDGQSVLVRARILRLATSSIPDLQAEDTIEVGDLDNDAALTTYRVTDVQRSNDGVETVVSVVT